MTISDELVDGATQLRTRPIEPPPPIDTLRHRLARRRTRRAIAVAVAVVLVVGVVAVRERDETGSVDVTDRGRGPTAWISYGASLLEINANTVIRHEPDPETFTPIYEIFAIDSTRFAARVANTVSVRSADGTFLRTIGDGRLIAGPNNSLWLANGFSSTISRIDPTTFATEERLTIGYTSIVAITDQGVVVSEPRNSALTRVGWDGQKSTLLDQPYRYAVVNRAGTRIAYALESDPTRLRIATIPTDNSPLIASVTVDVPVVFNVVWAPDDLTVGIIEVVRPDVANQQSEQQRFVPAFVNSQPNSGAATLRALSDAALDEPGQLVFVTPNVAYFIGGNQAARIDLRATPPRLTRVQPIAAQVASTSTSCMQSATTDQQRAIDFNGDGKLVIGVAAPGPRNDGAYYQALTECANRFAKANNGAAIIVDRIPIADAATEIEDLVKQSVDIMMIGASEISKAVPELAKKYDKTFWYCNCGSGAPASQYVAQSQDDNAEISYTAGYATGLLLKNTDKSRAAFIGNSSFDFEVVALNSFKRGLQAIDQSFDVTYFATGSFDDSAKATSAYHAAKAQGIGAVYPYLGGAHETVVKLANDDDIITMSAGPSNACQRSDLDYQIAVRFDSGDYLNALVTKLVAGQLAEGSVYTFHVGVDKEPGAQICKATADQQRAMDALYGDIASGKVKTE